MKNGVEFARRFAPGEQVGEEIIAVAVVRDAAIDQVDELGAVGEVVDDDDVVPAACVESAHKVAADEAGATGDDDHETSRRWRIAATRPVVEQPLRKGSTRTSPPFSRTCVAPAMSSSR